MENKSRELRYSYNVMDANKSFFYVILMNLLAPFALYLFLIIFNIFGKIMSGSAYNFVYSIFLSIIIPALYILVILIYHEKQNIDFKSAVKNDKKISIINIFLVVGISAVCIICFFPLINMVYSLFESWGINVSGEVSFEMSNWWTLLIGIFMYCIIPAVVEEILFRGIMLNGLLKRVKPYVAVILSATAFFIMHGSIAQSLYQIILGLILSLLFYFTGNILYPIIFHFLNNFLVVILAYFNIGGFLNGFSMSVGGAFAGIGLFILGLALIFGVFVLMRFLTKRKKTLEFVVAGNNIIIEEPNEKFGFKKFFRSLILDEKFYFYSAWVIAIIMWLFNSI